MPTFLFRLPASPLGHRRLFHRGGVDFGRKVTPVFFYRGFDPRLFPYPPFCRPSCGPLRDTPGWFCEMLCFKPLWLFLIGRLFFPSLDPSPPPSLAIKVLELTPFHVPSFFGPVFLAVFPLGGSLAPLWVFHKFPSRNILFL